MLPRTPYRLRFLIAQGMVCLLLASMVQAQGRSTVAPVAPLDKAAVEKVTADDSEWVGAYFLSHAYPNPFNPQTRLRFAVAAAQPVKVTLHDMLGRQLRVLYQGTPEARQLLAVTIDGHRLTTGLYVVRLSGTDFVTTRTITLIK